MGRLVIVVSCWLALLATGAVIAGAHGAGVSQCATRQLAARTRSPTAGLGHDGFVLVLTNRSSARCRTGGYVGLLRLGVGGRPLPTKLHRGSGYLYESGPPRTLVLGPGRSASAGVEWLGGLSPIDPQDCPSAGRRLEVTPPNARTHLTIRATTGDCDAGFMSTTALVAGTGGPRT
ncbi:MAG TPA: DUF4232 domain-containing protein [Solirubrobacteraceae bacterium]|nr:DUF4232 domain-containing protein [Solirubrobacteraceae bacterium]